MMANPFWRVVSCWERMRFSAAARSALVSGLGAGLEWAVACAPGGRAEEGAGAGSDAAIDWASARALAEGYWASSSARRLESLRISFGFCEIQRATARFISPLLQRNMKTMGRRETRTAPYSMRVRRREPIRRLRWSA